MTGLKLYNSAAEASANAVISAYSTSFGLAVRVLDKKYRQHVANIYALVRVADEIVDGSAEEAKKLGGSVNPQHVLDDLEKEVYRAIAGNYSANLIVHAFAQTARYAGIDKTLIKPFFESMRMDLWKTSHDERSFKQYVYGSAEVIGLMCLKVFMVGESKNKSDTITLNEGAKALGSAFQKVNFLRDLNADKNSLGRSYFPGINPRTLTDNQRDLLVTDINSELALAAKTLPLLPLGARKAVGVAYLLFRELNLKIARTPAKELMNSRIRVSDFKKLLLLLQAMMGRFN